MKSRNPENDPNAPEETYIQAELKKMASPNWPTAVAQASAEQLRRAIAAAPDGTPRRAELQKALDSRLSAAPGGDAAPTAPSDAQLQPAAAAPGTPTELGTRLERIRSWHQITSAKAFETKLLIFFTGMEIKALKADLGITDGRPSGEMVETVSNFSAGRASTWQELIESECGITSRSARNYVALYDNMIFRAPGFVKWVIEHASPRIAMPRKVLALPDPQAVIARIAPEALQEFRDALDPYNLTELYEKPIKPAIAQARVEHAKRESDRREEQSYFDFWCAEIERAAQKRTWQVLPIPQRKVLLETLETTVREIKASLRGEQ